MVFFLMENQKRGENKDKYNLESKALALAFLIVPKLKLWTPTTGKY